jgi:flagellin
MAAVLNTNMASLYAQKNLSTAQTTVSDSVRRLSSGTRINSAKDDAAGYGIAESLKGTRNIVNQNILNAQNGISWAQTAEGALDVVGKILQRALTLSTQATDASLNQTQLDSIDDELTALEIEIDNIAARTRFQGGSGVDSVFDTATLDVETGAEIGDATITLEANIVGGDGSLVGATTADIETLIAENATNRGLLGAGINSLQYAIDNMQTLSTNLADGISRIVDTDYAAETANLTRAQILQQAATSMLAQANQMPNVILTLLK